VELVLRGRDRLEQLLDVGQALDDLAIAGDLGVLVLLWFKPGGGGVNNRGRRRQGGKG